MPSIPQHTLSHTIPSPTPYLHPTSFPRLQPYLKSFIHLLPIIPLNISPPSLHFPLPCRATHLHSLQQSQPSWTLPINVLYFPFHTPIPQLPSFFFTNLSKNNFLGPSCSPYFNLLCPSTLLPLSYAPLTFSPYTNPNSQPSIYTHPPNHQYLRPPQSPHYPSTPTALIPSTSPRAFRFDFIQYSGVILLLYFSFILNIF